MGVLKGINPNPRLTKALIERQIFNKNKLTVIEVGARGGFEDLWIVYKDQIQLIGFEADEDECIRLNKQSSNNQNKYYPAILDRNRSLKKFYITSYPPSSGFYKPDQIFWSRFPDYKNIKVEKTISVDTVNLDFFLKENHIPTIDFIKLDVEGAELDILEGAKGILKKSVIGLSVEVEFFPTHIGQSVFSDVDNYLRSIGFILFDLTLNRHARKVLSGNSFYKTPGPTIKGQVLWGQAVYLKDAVSELQKSKKSFKFWNRTRILKLASFMELINLQDCAIELMEIANQYKIFLSTQVKKFNDLLTPSLNGKYFSYRSYLSKLKNSQKQKIRQASFVNNTLSPIKKLLPRSLNQFIHKLLVELRSLIDIIIGAG